MRGKERKAIHCVQNESDEQLFDSAIPMMACDGLRCLRSAGAMPVLCLWPTDKDTDRKLTLRIKERNRDTHTVIDSCSH